MVPRIAATAQSIVADNGLAERIKVVGKKSTDLQVGVDLQRPADLLVSEVFSSELLGEGVLQSIEDAKARLLTPTATIIPAEASIMIALIAGRELSANVRVDQVMGFDLSRFNSIYAHKVACHRDDLKPDFLSDEIEAFRFDFVANNYFAAETKRIQTVIRRPGRCFGIIQWIRLRLHGQHLFENHPLDHNPSSSWQHKIFRLPTPLDLQAGQLVTIQAVHNRIIAWFSMMNGSF